MAGTPAARGRLLAALVLAFAAISAAVWSLALRQPAGIDFAPLWTGVRAGLAEPARLYDFAHVSALQGWPLGEGRLRPFAYPPTAALLLAPFAALPYATAYVAWTGVTGGLFLAAAARARLPWWFVALPPAAFVAYTGQVTFLVGGLMLLALALKDRAVLAGVLWGLAACVKPQLLVLAPVALLAERRWTTLAAAAATGLALAAASAGVFGPDAWRAWLAALPRFQALVFEDPALLADAITPHALLRRLGLPGAWAYLLVPAAAWAVWRTFRTEQDLARRLAVVAGGALLVTPYAMHYDLALLAPAVAAGLAGAFRTRGWLVGALACVVYAVGFPLGPLTIVAGAGLAWTGSRYSAA